MTDVKWRSLLAEGLGTACLVFFAVGTATLSFGFKVTGSSTSTGWWQRPLRSAWCSWRSSTRWVPCRVVM
jgi:hypothetical protein